MPLLGCRLGFPQLSLGEAQIDDLIYVQVLVQED